MRDALQLYARLIGVSIRGQMQYRASCRSWPQSRQFGKKKDQTLNLWPGLLAAAVMLNIAELVNRKWKGLVDFFRRR